MGEMRAIDAALRTGANPATSSARAAGTRSQRTL